MARTVALRCPHLEAPLVDVETEIGRLYELPPEGFVAARDQLGRRLRESGDREAAERVRGLRRPTVAAWAVNQVARGRPELIAELLEAGDRLRQAQRRALSGLRDSGLRAAATERRELLDRLLAAATGVLVQAGRTPEAHQEAIAASFEAASVDAEAAAAVRGGTLGRELAAPAGFGEVTGLELLRARPPAPKPAARRPRGDAARQRELEATRRRVEGLRRRAGESARAAAEAREAADGVEQEADAAGKASDRLSQAARSARRAADEARRAAEEAGREAELAHDHAQRVLRRSRAADARAREAEARAWSAREALEEAERQAAELEADE